MWTSLRGFSLSLNQCASDINISCKLYPTVLHFLPHLTLIKHQIKTNLLSHVSLFVRDVRKRDPFSQWHHVSKRKDRLIKKQRNCE